MGGGGREGGRHACRQAGKVRGKGPDVHFLGAIIVATHTLKEEAVVGQLRTTRPEASNASMPRSQQPWQQTAPAHKDSLCACEMG